MRSSWVACQYETRQRPIRPCAQLLKEPLSKFPFSTMTIESGFQWMKVLFSLASTPSTTPSRRLAAFPNRVVSPRIAPVLRLPSSQ